MAAGGAVCRLSPADSSQENANADQGEAGSLHERLVAYVHALENGSRRGVWGEHSYARARLSGSGGGEVGGTRRARAMLAPRPPSPPTTLIDVEGPPSPPRSPPSPTVPPSPMQAEDEQDDDPADEEDWEARVMALAPSPSHARLATAVVDALRRMRLERLTEGGGRRARGQALAASRRLRLALASTWHPASGTRAAPAWLQSALTSCMPRGPRRLYEEALSALRRSRPLLAERLSGPLPPRPPSPRPSPAPAVPPTSEPWLVWVSSGCKALDERWERRLKGLMHTRVLRMGPGVGVGGAVAPEAWCAGVAGAVRSQLTDALAEAGDRSIILGGVGAGAALCLLLARGAGGAERAAGGVRGAVLAAPPLRTAEGGRGARDDALRAVRLPLLLLVGTHAPDAPRAIAHDVCERSGAGGAGPRRVLEVHGADGSLRLPRRMRRRLCLPQHALDAALVEECVRWAIETAEGEESPPSPPRPSPSQSPSPSPRRHALPTIVHQIDLDGDDDYSHLPQATVSPSLSTPPSTITTQSARSIEIIEGRVVSRTAGGTPLPLLPPSAPCPPCPPCPSPADIMQMPIVFADDNATDSSSTGSPVTVTSGKARGSSVTPPVKMTRVILAKRGGGTGAPRGVLSAPPMGMGTLAGRAGGGVLTIRPRVGAGPPPTRGVRVRVRGAGAGNAPRRLLVGQGMRVISRPDKS